MKKILLLVAAIGLSFSSFAQETEGTPISYSEVITEDGISKNDLYDRAMTFFVSAYKNPDKVIQMSDKESGLIIAKGVIETYFKTWDTYVHYTLTVAVKEGRYKYEIKDIYLVQLEGGTEHSYGLLTTSDTPSEFVSTWMKKAQIENYQSAKEQSNEEFQKLIALLKISMSKPAISNVNDNW